jgi:predicted HAD superfamily Cof-like phosphohydrolase
MKTNYLKSVEEFMTTMKQPVVEIPTVMRTDRNKLRIALIFEELKEYAEASGLSDYFAELCNKEIGNFFVNQDKEYVPSVNITEQFDALIDMQYVLTGAVIENGFKNIKK